MKIRRMGREARPDTGPISPQNPFDPGCVKTRTLADDAECYSQLSLRARAACSSCARKCNLEELCSLHFAHARLFAQPGSKASVLRCPSHVRLSSDSGGTADLAGLRIRAITGSAVTV